MHPILTVRNWAYEAEADRLSWEMPSSLAERKECRIGIMDNNESQRQAWEQVTKASDRLLEELPDDDSTIGNLSAG